MYLHQRHTGYYAYIELAAQRKQVIFRCLIENVIYNLHRVYKARAQMYSVHYRAPNGLH